MKVKVTFKSPDALDYGIQDLGKIDNETKREILDVAREWIDCGEYCTIEIDTETRTAKVLHV